ncbi:MAG: hypothetical protein HOO06_00835 [Bdellovibrionaceae bacterium]|jgi:hypothetical protein|nr:hypothetical protein [Pseudobdellovibrionaceae bacterium]
MNSTLILLLTFIFFSLPALSETKSSQYTLSLQKGFSLKEFERPPYGFESSHLLPPLITLNIKKDVPTSYWQVQLDFMSVGLPFINFDYGGKFKLSPNLEFTAGLGITLNNVIKTEPYKDSQFSYVAYSLFANGEYQLGPFLIGTNFRFKEITETTLASFESKTTKIDHDSDYILSPYILVDVYILKLKGEYTLYQLGRTAIASDDFGYGYNSLSVGIAKLSVGIPLPKMTLWITYQKLDNISDETAFMYQAPHFSRDYLLAKEAAFANLTWRF